MTPFTKTEPRSGLLKTYLLSHKEVTAAKYSSAILASVNNHQRFLYIQRLGKAFDTDGYMEYRSCGNGGQFGKGANLYKFSL